MTLLLIISQSVSLHQKKGKAVAILLLPTTPPSQFGSCISENVSPVWFQLYTNAISVPLSETCSVLRGNSNVA